MIIPLAAGVLIVAYGVYLYAIGERHRSEEHSLGNPPHCVPSERFECRYAMSTGLAIVVIGALVSAMPFLPAFHSVRP